MKVTAIIGTYRRGGIIDTAVDEILASARGEGAEAEKIYLQDKHLEFCTNCRACTQQPGEKRGKCPINDDMNWILETIDQSDALVLASPMNFGTVTAVMKRFIERLVCFAWWPWGTNIPKARSKRRDKRAVLVVSSAAPSIMARFLSPVAKPMKTAAGLLGAKTFGTLYIGFSAKEQNQDIGERTRQQARQFGKALALRH